MTLTLIFSVLIIHWFADFVLQTDKQAKGKSKDWFCLLSHTFDYSLVWLLPACILIGLHLDGVHSWELVKLSFIFVGITFVLHTITDYFTSRLNSKLWSEGKTHSFFVSIGFDQILHYVQLFLTFHFLLKLS